MGESLTSGESFFSRVLTGLDSALCVVDRSGVIEASNTAFALLAGQTPEALRGHSLATLLPEPQAAPWLARLAAGATGDATMATTLGGASGTQTNAPFRRVSSGGSSPGGAIVSRSRT